MCCGLSDRVGDVCGSCVPVHVQLIEQADGVVNAQSCAGSHSYMAAVGAGRQHRWMKPFPNHDTDDFVGVGGNERRSALSRHDILIEEQEFALLALVAIEEVID